MKTKSELQADVDAIRALCKERGVALMGVAVNEYNIDAEIWVLDVRDKRFDSHRIWSRCNSTLAAFPQDIPPYNNDDLYVSGIGDLP